MADDKEKSIGGIWVKQGKNGEFFSVSIGKVKYVGFKNDYATAENRQPTYKIYKAREQGTPPEESELQPF